MIEVRLFPSKFVAVYEDGSLRRKFNLGDPCNAPGTNAAGRIKAIGEKSVTLATGGNTKRLSPEEFGTLNKDYNWGWAHVTSPMLGKMLWGDD